VSFPEDLDFDRVMLEVLGGIESAWRGWKRGGLLTEEPFMNRVIEPFNRSRRGCDVGASAPMMMTSQLALLHRRGENQTDAFGSDLAVTVEIPAREFRKTALFQLKVGDGLSVRLERDQIGQAHASQATADRSFVMVADRERPRLRVQSTRDVEGLFHQGNETATRDCSGWPTLGQWVSRWLSCEVGVPSRFNDRTEIEPLLERFVIERPAEWDDPWGRAPDPLEYPSNQRPAKAWLEMFFMPSGDKELIQKHG